MVGSPSVRAVVALEWVERVGYGGSRRGRA